MKKLLLAIGLFFVLAGPTSAQNTTCSDRPVGDSSNACANTRFVQSTSGATSIQPVNVVNLGAKCDWNGTTGTDDHVIIQNALNTYRNVLIPSQCYIGTSTLTFGNLAFATITGINSEWSAIIQASTNTATISILAAIPGLKIEHLGITKPVATVALAGATGILFNGYNDLPVINDVEVQKHFVGVSLSSTSYGKFQNSYIHDNLSDCIAIQNPTILNDYQWNFDTVLSQTCGGWGVNVVTGTNIVLGPKSSQGTWTNVFTFNNTLGGVRFLGNATVPIQGVRLNSPFLGADKGPELVLDTFNTSIGSHIITSPYLEFNTAGTCLSITANNNGGISIINPAISTCFTSGVSNAANNVFIIGGFITAANTFSVVNSGSIDILHSDLLGSTSGAVSNTGTYIGHLNLPAAANTPFAVIDGGTGISSFGTGVATALGINTGTAGSMVINGGVLGTPSSGTVTNLTGTAGININGTVGATTPNSGAFTTLGASTSITATGASANLLAAGRAGATNPAFNVDASTASSATGLNVKAAAAGGNLAISVLSSGSNEALIVDAKGTGSINFGTTSSGFINLFRQTFIGTTSLAPASGTTLTVSQNTGGTPLTSAFGNISLQAIAADTVSNVVLFDSFGAGTVMAGRASSGTQASKTALAGGSGVFTFGGTAWDGSAYQTGGALDFNATATLWSGSNRGMYIRFRTVADGATTLTERIRIQQGLSVGNTTDPGVGVVSATGGYVSNGLAGITTVCTIAVGNVLTFTLGIITAKGGAAGCT